MGKTRSDFVRKKNTALSLSIRITLSLLCISIEDLALELMYKMLGLSKATKDWTWIQEENQGPQIILINVKERKWQDIKKLPSLQNQMLKTQ